jgi:Polyketide cyclase / dehydrase and lipid transport
MRRYSYETNTAVSAEKLFRAKTDICHWPEWDSELEATAFDAPLMTGSPFMLKPKGGPKVAMRIEHVEAPRRFVDLAFLPLAKMRTSTEFLPAANGTCIRVTIEVFGPLAFFWDRVVARKLAADCEQQTQAFIAAAERRS